MRSDPSVQATHRHPAEEDLDTEVEQADRLLHDLRESFAPSYLTLISIIEGVLLGLTFQFMAEGRATSALFEVASLLVFNNIVLIALVWNEYRMGSSMFRWIPSLADAIIPFTIGALQAALVLTTPRPELWLLWLGVFYAAAAIAYENMYRRAEEEQRNSLVFTHNRVFRWLNPAGSLLAAVVLIALAAAHVSRGATPGLETLLPVTVANLLFLLRGEVNWRMIVRAARVAAARK